MRARWWIRSSQAGMDWNRKIVAVEVEGERIPKVYTTTEGWRPRLGATDKMLYNHTSYRRATPAYEKPEKHTPILVSRTGCFCFNRSLKNEFRDYQFQ